MLWANKYEEAKDELKSLKTMGPPDLMPNIQYWLGEVFYAQKNFERAVIEFGDGLQKYPDSIKGPDNMLKLGLSFSGTPIVIINLILGSNYMFTFEKPSGINFTLLMPEWPYYFIVMLFIGLIFYTLLMFLSLLPEKKFAQIWD